MRRTTNALLAAMAIVLPQRALAQSPPAAAASQAAAMPSAGNPDSGSSWFAERFNGQVQIFSEMYGVDGIARRRPGGTWRAIASPRLGLIAGTEVGLDIVLSSEGNDARQSINQFALEPDWGWGQLHLGDFSKDYSPYTMQGLRIRGAGLDLNRWGVRASVQGGRSASLISTADGPTYRRNVVAGALGIGREGERSLDLRIVRAQDALIPDEMPAFDTVGFDTLPADLRPQQRTRPQLNVVGALGGSLRMFNRKLAVKAEVAGAILTRDLTSPVIDADSIDTPGAGATTLRTSSLGDLAWNSEVQWAGRSYGLRGGYESVGAGFTSLGLAYLINDRRSWNAAGDVRLLQGALALQTRFQRQENNLQSQRVSTTTRDVLTGTATMRLPARITASFVALIAMAGNEETNDTLLVDNSTSTYNASLSMPWRFAGRAASAAVAYSLQSTEDRNPVRLTPEITVQTANMTVSVPLWEWLTIAPSVAAVLPDGQPDGENVLGSMRATATGLKGMSLSGQFTQTFVSARRATTGTLQFGYQLPGEFQFTAQARLLRFGALGTRPAFSERFLTTTLGRSF